MKDTKMSVILVLMALLLALGAVCAGYRDQYLKQKERASSFENTITDLRQDISMEKLRLNDSVELYQAQVKSLTFSRDNLQSMYGDLLKASKLRPKDVSSMVNVGLSARSVDTVPVLVDTFGGTHARLEDKWATIDVEINKERQACFDYEFRDSLSVLEIKKKHSLLFGLIKWTSLEATRVISHNPKSKITGLQTIEVIK